MCGYMGLRKGAADLPRFFLAGTECAHPLYSEEADSDIFSSVIVFAKPQNYVRICLPKTVPADSDTVS